MQTFVILKISMLKLKKHQKVNNHCDYSEKYRGADSLWKAIGYFFRYTKF